MDDVCLNSLHLLGEDLSNGTRTDELLGEVIGSCWARLWQPESASLSWSWTAILQWIIPYRYLHIFLAVDSIALLGWYVCHLGLFVLFYAFANPIYASVGEKEAVYSLGSLGLSFIMFWVALYHAPDPPGFVLPREAIQIVLPAVFVSVPLLLSVDAVLRATLRRTLAGSLRALMVNIMLVSSCVTVQYGYCVSTTPASWPVALSSVWDGMGQRNLSISIEGLESSFRAAVGHGSRFCGVLDQPAHFPCAVLGTLAVLCLWSTFLSQFLRHGILIIERVSSPPVLKTAAPLPEIGEISQHARAWGGGVGMQLEDGAEMCPWYATHALYALIALVIQLKLFLGRFDPRTMRAMLRDTAGFANKAGSTEAVDVQVDRRFATQAELWFDFVADTGDGFNSTYTMARSLAQPQLRVDVSGVPAWRRNALKLVKRMVQSGSRVFLASSRPTVGGPLVGSNSDGGQSSAPRSPCSDGGSNVGEGEREHEFKWNEGHIDFDEDFACLPRGELLLHGGDLAYPQPRLEVYERRFFGPFAAALPPPRGVDPEETASDVRAASAAAAAAHASPCCWIIPGNHDWFDGLETFLHTICGRHWLGGWHLPQLSTYWALELPHRWFALGLDLGLNEDLDDAQYNYFHKLLADLPGDASVIVITHAPFWFNNNYSGHETGRMYRRLLALFGTKLRLLLAGDIHHYSRYSPGGARASGDLPELVISGGGGAFLHPTHFTVDVPGYQRVSVYPAPQVSRGLAIKNLWSFRRRNWAFEIFVGLYYVSMGLAALPLCGETEAARSKISGGASLTWTFAGLVLHCYQHIFDATTVPLLAHASLVLVTLLWVEPQWGRCRRILWATSLSLAHSLCAVVIVCGMELAVMTVGDEGHKKLHGNEGDTPVLLHNLPPPWNQAAIWSSRSLLSLADLPTHMHRARQAVCAAGAEVPRSTLLSYIALALPYFWVLATPLAMLLMGTYLMLASLAGRHFDESFSSMRIDNYKNFLRMHIDQGGSLTIFAIGVDKVARDWLEDPLWLQAEANGSSAPKQRIVPSRWKPKKPLATKLVDHFRIAASGCEIQR